MSAIELPNLGLTGDTPDHALWGAQGRANDRRLDALTMASVKSILNDPPASPADGDRHLVGTSPSGVWAGKSNAIAAWNAALNAWVFYTPKTGWSAYLESTRSSMRYASSWFSDDLAMNVKVFGAKGDGATDDTAAVLAAITAAPAGARLHFPAGTYRLSSWSLQSLTKRLWLSGDGMGATIIKGASGASFLSITTDHRCSDLTFDTWSTVLDFSGVASVIEKVLVENVEIKNYRRGFHCDTGLTVGVGFRNLAIRDCRFITGSSYAIYIDSAITEFTHVQGCYIKDCVNRAIGIGDNTLGFSDNRGSFVIEGNLIDGVTNGAGPPTNTTAAIAIICYGWRATITNNIVRNVTKLDPTATDCDGIYTKCRYATVVNNVLVDAGQGEAFLNIKGGARDELVVQPHGFAVIVANNVCLDTQVAPTFADPSYTPLTVTVDAGTNVFTTPVAHGLVVGNRVIFATDDVIPGGLSPSSAYHVRTAPAANTFTVATTSGAVADRDITSVGTGTHTVTRASAFKRTNGIKVATSDVLVTGNLFDSLTEIAIYTDSDTGASHPNHNVLISDNLVVNHRGKAGMSIYGRGDNIRVLNNLVDGVLNSWTPTSQGFGIDINKKEGTGLDIVGNRVYGVVNVSNSVGISLSPSAVEKYVSADHNTETFTATASHLGAAIAHTFAVDDRLQFTTTGVLPAGLALGTWYKVASVPTLYTFTLKDDVLGTPILITDNGTGELTANKQITFTSWRIADNQIDGAKYGVQFNWDPAYVLVDDVLVRHNTGRNINGNAVPVLSDLVKYSDTPTNLIDLPARAETVARTSTTVAVLRNPGNLQNLRVFGNDDGAGNDEWIALRAKSTAVALESGLTGTGIARPLEIIIAGVSYWRFFTDGSLRPITDEAVDIGTSSVRVRTVYAGGAGAEGIRLLPGDHTGGWLRLGTYRLWVDSTGDLRIKNGTPASDLDGTVVGTQS